MDRAYMGEDADLPPLASECAFFALVRAVFAFVTEDDMDWPADMTGVIEIELDPWTADAVEWALGALYPRGTGTAEDKETFWTWWLTEAVPQAWMSAKKDE